MNEGDWRECNTSFRKTITGTVKIDTFHQIRDALLSLGFQGGRGIAIDVGCGLGDFARKFGAHFLHLISIDVNRSYVTRAWRNNERHCRNASWLCKSLSEIARDLPGEFDLVVSLNVITYPRVDERSNAWRDMAKLLTSGGAILAVVPSFESNCFVRDIQRSIGNRVNRRGPNGLVSRSGSMQKFYSIDDVRREIGSNFSGKLRIEPLSYSWRLEGIESRKAGKFGLPWDWLVTSTL